MEKISRKQAEAQGLKYYFTGDTCKNGHVDKRRVSNSTCVSCENIVTKKWQAANKEHKSEYDKIYHPKYFKKYYKTNKSAVLARSHKRRAAEIQATPMWYEHEEIMNLYQECRDISVSTGIQHHVDHIIPLRGSNVCGLHCLANLQILTASDNLSKGNKL